MTEPNPFGGQQLVKNPFTGQWEYANAANTGGDTGKLTAADLAALLGDGDSTFPYREFQGTIFYLNPSSGQWEPIGASTTTGGDGGGGVSPESYALQQQQDEMTQRHYYINDALAAQQEDRLRLNDEWQRAVNEGNLALARQTEQRIAANEAQTLALNQQQQAIDAALGQAQVGANVYGTQTQGRSSQLSTLAQLAKDAADAAANPWNSLGYLDLNAAAGGVTPYSNATPAQYTDYNNAMAQAWQSKYGGVANQLNQSIANTYQTPAAITTALQKMVPLQTPVAQTPTQTALARYAASTPGEKKALAGATPEQLLAMWQAGQVR